MEITGIILVGGEYDSTDSECPVDRLGSVGVASGRLGSVGVGWGQLGSVDVYRK